MPHFARANEWDIELRRIKRAMNGLDPEEDPVLEINSSITRNAVQVLALSNAIEEGAYRDGTTLPAELHRGYKILYWFWNCLRCDDVLTRQSPVQNIQYISNLFEFLKDHPSFANYHQQLDLTVVLRLLYRQEEARYNDYHDQYRFTELEEEWLFEVSSRCLQCSQGEDWNTIDINKLVFDGIDMHRFRGRFRYISTIGEIRRGMEE